MKKNLYYALIALLILSSCRKHGQDTPFIPPQPTTVHFTSMFRDTANAIVFANSYGFDFARVQARDTSITGKNFLKIIVRQLASSPNPYESVELLIDKSALSTGLKGKYKINFDGAATEPGNLKYYYNTNDAQNPIILYEAKQEEGDGYIEITAYDKDQKLLTGIFHSYALNVPDPFDRLIRTTRRWDGTLDGEFNNVKVQ